MRPSSLRILITCRELARRGGTQLYTRDLAEVLRGMGHSPVVFSPRLGEVGEELRGRGVAVIDSLDRLGEPPDVIHGQHHLEAMTAMLRFPAVPALFVCHGWLPWEEAPPRFPSLLFYVAVDSLRRDRLVLEHGVSGDQVAVIPNFVDLDRFRSRPPLPPRPRRAVLLSNQAAPQTFVPVVERVCAEAGIELSVAGVAAGRPVARPEDLLASADLVFARGRSALEAMAVGAAVVLCDVEGCGPLVDASNFAALRDLNFGMGALTPPVDPERLRAEIGRYDPEEALRVRDRVRREAGRTEAVARLVSLYRELVDTAPGLAGEEYAAECLEAASRYVHWIGPRLDAAESRLETVAAGLTATGAQLKATEARLAASEARLTATEAQLEDSVAVLHVLERSPFSRLRRGLLGLRPLVAAWRAAKRLFP